jgi:uncharacterized protein YaiE (UPF0345 family)
MVILETLELELTAGKLMRIRNISGKRTIILAIAIGVMLTLLRLFKVRNIEPIFGPYDAPSYFNFVFSGGIRMPLITFIFSTIENHFAIVLFQTFVSGIAWILLSASVVHLSKNMYINFVSLILIYSLGYSKQVVYLDSGIDAESLNISFLVILLSALIFSLKRSSTKIHIFLLITCILFAGIKSINGVTVLIPLMYLLIKILRSSESTSKSKKILSILTILTSLLSLYLFSQIQNTKLYNTSALINSRLWDVPDWKEYTIGQGFPVQARSTFVRFTNQNLGSAPDAAVGSQPDYIKWYQSGGSNFLLKFMLTHPGYTFLGPVVYPLFTKELNLENTIWRGAADGILYFESRQHQLAKIWPESYIFWAKDRSTGYIQVSIFLSIIAMSLITFRNRTNIELSLSSLIIFLLFFTFSMSYFAWWFGSTPSDLGRHQFPFAISLRICCILSLTILLNRLFKLRRN